MKKSHISAVPFLSLLVLILCFGFASNVFAQATIGKIFTKADADKQFGPVLKSVTLKVSEVKTILSKSNNYVLFDLSGDKVRCLDEKRTALNEFGRTAKSGDPFHKYSRSKVEELISLGDGATVTFETRANVFSITSGATTLEMGASCPPWCE